MWREINSFKIKSFLLLTTLSFHAHTAEGEGRAAAPIAHHARVARGHALGSGSLLT